MQNANANAEYKRSRLYVLASLVHGDQTLSVRPNARLTYIPESRRGGDPHTTTSGGSQSLRGKDSHAL